MNFTQQEIELLARLVRSHLRDEEAMMHTAACARDPIHAADVRRQVEPRRQAVLSLLNKLQPRRLK